MVNKARIVQETFMRLCAPTETGSQCKVKSTPWAESRGLESYHQPHTISGLHGLTTVPGRGRAWPWEERRQRGGYTEPMVLPSQPIIRKGGHKSLS